MWIEIAAHPRAAGYENRDDGSCKTQIHTLISPYRSYKDECAKTGNATPKKKPALFDEMDELLPAFCKRCCQLLLFGVKGDADDHVTMFNLTWFH